MGKGHIRAKWKGGCRIRAYDINDKLVYDQESMNIFVNDGKDNVGKYIVGITGGSVINKIGVGDGDATPSFGDGDLDGVNSLVKDIVDKTYVRPNAVIGVEFLFAEANFTWKEAGVFAGTTLIARALFNPEFEKTNLLRGTAEWTIRIE